MTLGAIPEAKVPREDELERDEKFLGGRMIVVAVDHGPNSHAAFAWALDQFITHADTVHLLHVLPKSSGGPSFSTPTSGGSDVSPIYDATQLLFDKLTKEAYEKKCNVKVVSVFRSGDPGKEIVAEATRTKAVAVVMGCRGLSGVKRALVGSSTDYCVQHSPVPLIIVPHHFQPSSPTEDIGEEEQEKGWKVDGS